MPWEIYNPAIAPTVIPRRYRLAASDRMSAVMLNADTNFNFNIEDNH
jgi:hypothetical protein